MPRAFLAVALSCAVALSLAGCEDELPRLPPTTPLPPIPADLRACLKGAAVAIPDRALTVGEVERLWKQDGLARASAKKVARSMDAPGMKKPARGGPGSGRRERQVTPVGPVVD